MCYNREPYPVVDLFAGPGGLGEGFALCKDLYGIYRFRNVVSIEKDVFAHRTLLLRHFVRSFGPGRIPPGYYDYLLGKMTREELFVRHASNFEEAQHSALKISLGSDIENLVFDVIKKNIGGSPRWVLIGGPPCQAYSIAGRSRMSGNPEFEKDERHFLYREYLKIICVHKPPVFLMENVKGLLSSRVNGEMMINRIINDLQRPEDALYDLPDGVRYKLWPLTGSELFNRDYEPRDYLIKSELYGVPQARHRMFILGIRCDINLRPGRLIPRKAPKVCEMIGDLPAIRSGISRQTDSFDEWKKVISGTETRIRKSLWSGRSEAVDILMQIREILNTGEMPEHRKAVEYSGRSDCIHDVMESILDPELKVLTGHETRSHMAADLQRYLFAAVFTQIMGYSPKLADFPETLLPDHRNVESGRAGQMFADRFRVQLPDSVATTITSHISKDGHYYIHYDPLQCRSLTVREAARLQTFPDNYHFEGPRSSQYQQIGNAVPPYLARQIADVVAEVMDRVPNGKK